MDPSPEHLDNHWVNVMDPSPEHLDNHWVNVMDPSPEHLDNHWVNVMDSSPQHLDNHWVNVSSPQHLTPAAHAHFTLSCRDHKFLKTLINMNQRPLNDKPGLPPLKPGCINNSQSCTTAENTSGGPE
ncbi:hypothetical protein EOD39_21173 [Acipenser ruthenus]|uniref:Uncharacterized protein n=1 Tax=Acipenser ruthenus TaxID=7906 RepID=A0A444UTE7_ACIRT|nr:hypothetical protein EOD39_21173 [Acipenser ruthenus]